MAHKTSKKDDLQLLIEYSRELRTLATHEGEITNHRIQWFALLNGLLFATFGLLWESRDTCPEILAIVSVTGILTSLSCWASLWLGNRACSRLLKLYKKSLKRVSKRERRTIAPLMAYDRPLGIWAWMMPWTTIGPLFAIAWSSILVSVMWHSL